LWRDKECLLFLPLDVKVPEVSANQAVITYGTQNEVQGVIEYGTNPASLTQIAPETSSSVDHKVTLNLLSPNTTYYFTIKIGEKSYDNAGLPYSFITSGESAANPQTTIPTNIPIKPASSFPTLEPTVIITPAKLQSCQISDFQKHYGAMKGTSNYDANFDLILDGIINVADYMECLNKNK